MINCIYKPRGSRIWRWKFRQQPKDGKIEDVSLGTSDKQVAEKRRAELLRERQHERDGLIMAKPLRDAVQRKLTGHLEDFVGNLRRCGGCDKYLSNLEYRIKRLITECGWDTVKEVTSDSFQKWRRENKDLKPKTVNDYLDVARGLFTWMVKGERIRSNPLVSVEKVNRAEGEGRQRRAFSFEEMQKLVEAAGENKPVYLMAVHTGLRRSELASLVWDDIALSVVTPFIRVRASTTKNGKPVEMRLHPELVAVLKELKGEKKEAEPVFERIPRMKRFRRDLEVAGILYRDSLGRVADFHSLRKTLGTNLANAGVPSRVAMVLMRHSDRKLTDKIYTDENLLRTWSAIDALPSYTGGASQGASQKLVAVSQSESSSGTTGGGLQMLEPVVNIGESQGVACAVTSGQGEVGWCALQGLNLRNRRK